MIPLPRAWLLAGAMLVGTAVGIVLAIALTLLVNVYIRPDVVIALVMGIPSLIGMSLVLFSIRRWMTTLGAFLAGVGPGWFGVLLAIQAVTNA